MEGQSFANPSTKVQHLFELTKGQAEKIKTAARVAHLCRLSSAPVPLQ